MPDPSPSLLRPSDYARSFPFLGVRFFFAEPLVDVRNLTSNLAAMNGKIERATEDVRRRQKNRKWVAFWDAMTYLQHTMTHKEIRSKPEGKLALELMQNHAMGVVGRDVAVELANLPSLAGLSSLVWPLDMPGAKPTLSRDGHGLRWRETSEGGALIRLLRLNVPADQTDPSDLDWLRFTILAVLAHLRTDLDVWIETGFLRTRCCEQCHAWFAASRMAGRPRFCSANCRVAASRKSERR